MYRRYWKRILDVTLAGSGLILLSPLFALIALVVRIRHGSPVLFSQERAGQGAAPFKILKFRTMTNARDPSGRPLSDGERLTPLGTFLRSTSLDELPELINVLRGEMSLVGPRPWVTWYLDRYSQPQLRRYEVKPGITGWAQVNGRMALSWEKIFELDLWYVDHCSLGLDARILFRTLRTLVERGGINQPGYATAGEFMGDGTDSSLQSGTHHV